MVLHFVALVWHELTLIQFDHILVESILMDCKTSANTNLLQLVIIVLLPIAFLNTFLLLLSVLHYSLSGKMLLYLFMLLYIGSNVMCTPQKKTKTNVFGYLLKYICKMNSFKIYSHTFAYFFIKIQWSEIWFSTTCRLFTQLSNHKAL